MSEKLLSVEAYNSAEKSASENFSIRINQAFFPDMFSTVGYPSRVDNINQLWRYIDVMHEGRTEYNLNVLLKGLTPHEFSLFKTITKLVYAYSQSNYNKKLVSTSALLRAIHVMRSIKAVTKDARPSVLEIGPGCGYLGMLLLLEGYPYISVDVAQAFYLYQSHMFSIVSPNLRELAVDDGSISDITNPKPGEAIHIPWWKWITLDLDKVLLKPSIITCNHCLCEMHQGSLAYLAAFSNKVLENSENGAIVFDEWGYDLLRSERSILNKFEQFNFGLCHNEDGVSALVHKSISHKWNVYQGGKKSVKKQKKFKHKVKNFFRRTASELLLKNEIIVDRDNQSRVPIYRSDNPISDAITKYRRSEEASAVIQIDAINESINEICGGELPINQDELLFKITKTVW